MRRKVIIGFLAAATACILAGGFAICANTQDKKKDDLFKQVDLFSETLAIIHTDYVDDVKTKDLIYGALKGMVGSLDAHSQFMDPDTYNELKVDTEGKFGGLGIEITVRDSLLTVVTPIEGTPAWKAGIKAKDRIVKINNELTRDITLTEAVKKMRGKIGETVTLTILRENEKKLLEFKIVRDIIKIQDIKNPRILEDGIGYVRIVEFRENTSSQLDSVLDKLRKQGMSALIIDLRNNPGGLLDSAVAVAGKFIEKDKLVVSTKGRQPSQNMELTAASAKPILDLPMAVLINEGSASGSEIVAGALQNYKRAVIIGTKSFGKGSVQTIIPLNDGSALRLTTSKYFTPNGTVIHGKGVMPDIVIPNGKPFDLTHDIDIQEKQKAEEIFDNIEKKETELKTGDQDYTSDMQLVRAIDILKALKIFKQNSK